MINQLAGRCTEDIQENCYTLGLLPDIDIELRDFAPWENFQKDERKTASA